MNAFKAQWLEHTQDLHLPPFFTGDTPESTKSWDNEFVTRQTNQRKREIGMAAGMLAVRYMARSQLKGNVGIALRVTGRIGTRAIPIVGAVWTAYDIYRFLDNY
jgi:hypothetical protein